MLPVVFYCYVIKFFVKLREYCSLILGFYFQNVLFALIGAVKVSWAYFKIIEVLLWHK